uniref:Uncharacterized protein n=1 Tax=Oryza sativa subsp. japonica TaxID=39947 RepID=Q69IS1_ORYSJ|nr:hypothetical protein [Oryza sativa Japonica Group]
MGRRPISSSLPRLAGPAEGHGPTEPVPNLQPEEEAGLLNRRTRLSLASRGTPPTARAETAGIQN